jgi:AraC family transcriptional regulator
MEPQLITRTSFQVLGIAERVVPAEADYPAIWYRFEARRQEVAALCSEPGYYGVSLSTDVPGQVEYVAGMVVAGLKVAPEGLALRQIPAQRYAVFTCTLATISQTYAAIYGQWLPASGYECSEPGADYEYYPPDMGNPPDEPVYIYKAIREAGAAIRERTAQTVAGQTLAEPEIVALDAFFVAGTTYRGTNQQGEVVALWHDAFLPRAGELSARQADSDYYGVGRMPANAGPGEIEYLAGVKVTSLDDLPAGMVGWEIPANRYAVLPANDVPDLMAVAERFYGQWLPHSAYRAAGNYNIEYYPPSYPGTPTIYWYFPITEKGEQA